MPVFHSIGSRPGGPEVSNGALRMRGVFSFGDGRLTTPANSPCGVKTGQPMCGTPTARTTGRGYDSLPTISAPVAT